jgi:hypothetical protein
MCVRRQPSNPLTDSSATFASHRPKSDAAILTTPATSPSRTTENLRRSGACAVRLRTSCPQAVKDGDSSRTANRKLPPNSLQLLGFAESTPFGTTIAYPERGRFVPITNGRQSEAKPANYPSESEDSMAEENETQCGHPSCSCRVSADGEYCSAQCAAVRDTPDIDCRCGHAACKGRAH